MNRFTRFRGTNAGTYTEFDRDLRQQGLVRLMGPNGAGKSTFANMMTQVGYGKNPVGFKKSDLAGDEDFMLELSWERDGKKFVAATTSKSKTLSPAGKPYGSGIHLYIDGEDKSAHKDPDTQKLIQSYLGWTIEEWYGYVYLAQRSSHSLIHGTRSERQQYLSALFNIEEPLNGLAQFYKKKQEELEAKIKDIGFDKQTLALKIQNASQLDAEALRAEMNQKNAESLELSAKVSALTLERSHFEAKQTLQRTLQDIETKQSALGKTFASKAKAEMFLGALKDQQSERSAAQKNVQFLRGMLASLGAEPALPVLNVTDEERKRILETPDMDVAGEKKRLMDLLRLESQAGAEPQDPGPVDKEALAFPAVDTAKIRALIQQIQSRPAPPSVSRPEPVKEQFFSDEIVRINVELGSAQNRLKHLKFHGEVCDQCGSTLDRAGRAGEEQRLQEEVQNLQEELTVMRSQRQKLNEAAEAWKRYDQLGPDRSDEIPGLQEDLIREERRARALDAMTLMQARQTWLENQQKIQEIPALQKRIQDYMTKLELRGAEEKIRARETYLQQRDTLVKQIEQAEASLPEDVTVEVMTIQKFLEYEADRERALGMLEQFKDSHEVNAAEIESLRVQAAALSTQAGQISQRLQDHQATLDAIQKLQEKVGAGEVFQKDYDRCAILAKAFSRSGQLREHHLSKFSRYLEEALQSHTGVLLKQHRFKIVVDDGIDILCEKGGTGHYYDVKTMSGGEQGALSVAFLFALDDLLPPDRRTSFKILDEIEAGFDKDRRPDFVEFVLPELRKRAETILVISHSHEASSGVFDGIWSIQDGTIRDVTSDPRAFESV